MEVTQFTYFQQVGGYDCKPVAGELTYGLERLAMYIQGVDNVYDLQFNDEGVTYGDVFLENERQMSAYNFEVADTDTLFDAFRKAAAECENCLQRRLPIPAYEQAIQASHIFNTLQAPGAAPKAAAEGGDCRPRRPPTPADEQAIQASHIFNTLQARGVISVAERQAYIGRVRDLAKGACQAWMARRGGQP